METIVLANQLQPDQTEPAADYAGELAVQIKKGLLTYLILTITGNPAYSSELIGKFTSAGLDIPEGTIYPLLSRLSRDGLLMHQWQESEQGPPRKYYQITNYGQSVRSHMQTIIANLNNTIITLERSYQ